MNELLHSLGYWVHDLGAWGYPLAVLLMTGVAVLPIPAEIPAAMNGMLFGPVQGTVITWTGAVIGAQVSFELSRRFGRPLVERVLPSRAITKVDGVVTAASWPGLLVARLIPAIAFTVLNWGVGLTLCRRRTFIWTTAIGILPGTILFVSSGEGLARLYARHPTLAVAIVVVATMAIVIVAWRRRSANRAAPASASASQSADVRGR
jgi:uncharacterized membrane protein YdjX (TVP38/TMEM64 family)